jgi:hypothetical protein
MFDIYSDNWGWFHKLRKSRQGWRAIAAVGLVVLSASDILILVLMFVVCSLTILISRS